MLDGVLPSYRHPRRGCSLSGLRIGVMHNTINSKFGPKPLIQADYMTGLAAGADSFWVADHLNSVLPPSMWKPKYVGAARIIPKMDAHVEPWTMLGYLAGHNKVGRMTLGVAVTDTGRRNPAVTAQAAVTLQTSPRSSHPRHRNRRARRQRTLRSGVVQAGRPIRRGDGHYPRAVGFERRTRQPGVTVLPIAQRNVRTVSLQGRVARDLDRRTRPTDDSGCRKPCRRLVSRDHARGRISPATQRSADRCLGRRTRSDVDHSAGIGSS